MICVLLPFIQINIPHQCYLSCILVIEVQVGASNFKVSNYRKKSDGRLKRNKYPLQENMAAGCITYNEVKSVNPCETNFWSIGVEGSYYINDKKEEYFRDKGCKSYTNNKLAILTIADSSTAFDVGDEPDANSGNLDVSGPDTNTTNIGESDPDTNTTNTGGSDSSPADSSNTETDLVSGGTPVAPFPTPGNSGSSTKPSKGKGKGTRAPSVGKNAKKPAKTPSSSVSSSMTAQLQSGVDAAASSTVQSSSLVRMLSLASCMVLVCLTW